MQLYLEGLLMGVVPAFFVGPVLFTLLAAALDEGFAAGAQVAVGIAVSDVVAVAVCSAGLGPLLTQPWGQWALQVAGGVILAGFGAVLVATARRAADPSVPRRRAGAGRHVAAGFLVNFVNPFVFTFWIGALGGLGARADLQPASVAAFFGGMITTILATDLLKAWAAGALQRHLSGPILVGARRASGVLLAGAGLFLLGQAVAAGLPGGAA
jgi:threonine/homoserine/homoserine lactone efflux protein